MAHIVQISDTHLFGDKNATINGFNSYSNLQTIFNSISSLKEKPELIVVTGDLSQDCTAESYKHLYDFLLKSGIKYYLLPGNHDNVSIVNKVFNYKWARENVDYSADYKGWLFYFLDTSVYPEAHGELTQYQLQKLEDTLNKNKSKPTLIFMHHHPLQISSWLDGMILLDFDKFNSVVKQNPQIKGVLFGHIHQIFESNINGTFYGSAPSTSYQILPKTARFALDAVTQGYRLIELTTERFDSKVIRL